MFVNFDAWSQFVTSSLTFQPLSLKAYTNFDKDTWMIVKIVKIYVRRSSM